MTSFTFDIIFATDCKKESQKKIKFHGNFNPIIIFFSPKY